MLRKVRILLEWVVIGCLAFILVHALLRPDPVPDHNPAAWRTWDRFMVLSYATISTFGIGTIQRPPHSRMPAV